MTGADLQRLLADLIQLARTTGAEASVLAELEVLRKGLAPFRNYSVNAIVARLNRPDPVPGAADGTRPKAVKLPKAPKPDAEALAREVKDMYERAASPDVSYADLDTLVDRLNTRSVTVDDLLKIAERIDVFGKKKKADILAAIRRRLHDRKGGSERTSIIDRPEIVNP